MKNESYPSMQDWFNIWKSVNAIHHINQLEKKKMCNINICKKEAFDKIQHPFMIKNSQQTRNRKELPQLSKKKASTKNLQLT